MSGSHSERKGSVYPIPLKSKRPVSIYPVKDLKKIQSPLEKNHLSRFNLLGNRRSLKLR